MLAPKPATLPEPVATPFTRFSHGLPRRFRHCHEHGQLFLLTRGSARLETPQHAAAFHKGWFGWIPGNQAHDLNAVQAVAGLSFDIEGMPNLGFPTTLTVAPASPLVLELIRGLSISRVPARHSNILRVVADELEQAADTSPDPGISLSSNLIAAMRADPGSSSTLAAWAEVLGTSERTLVRKLRAETGKTFVELRTELRVALGSELLREGWNVTEVAFHVGYESPSAFARAFHALTGNQPQAILKRIRESTR